MKRGFTLIELLVVIAIIAILAAILFPVFARAREKARQSACLSNVKQLVLGVLMYVQDYDEVFIPGALPLEAPPAPTDGDEWDEVIRPYIKNEQIRQCPSAPRTWARGYGWNYQNFGYYYASHGTGWCTALALVMEPAGTILIGDNPDSGMYGAGTRYIYGPSQSTPPTDGIGNVSGRHNDGANYGFVDGHAKWLSRNDAGGQDRLWTQAAD